MGFLERFYGLVEQGRFFRILQLILLTALFAAYLISGFTFGGAEVYENKHSEVKRYIVKKVSRLPEKAEQKDTETEKREADTISPEDIKKRYISYVISKIEQNKIYPLAEQRLNHEGNVTFILEIKRSGEVASFTYLNRCRYSNLNSAAVEAVRKSAPFARIPPQLEEDVIRIKVNMSYFLR